MDLTELRALARAPSHSTVYELAAALHTALDRLDVAEQERAAARALLAEQALVDPDEVVVRSLYSDSSDTECFYCGADHGGYRTSELGYHAPDCWFVRARAALAPEETTP